MNLMCSYCKDNITKCKVCKKKFVKGEVVVCLITEHQHSDCFKEVDYEYARVEEVK